MRLRGECSKIFVEGRKRLHHLQAVSTSRKRTPQYRSHTATGTRAIQSQARETEEALGAPFYGNYDFRKAREDRYCCFESWTCVSRGWPKKGTTFNSLLVAPTSIWTAIPAFDAVSGVTPEDSLTMAVFRVVIRNKCNHKRKAISQTHPNPCRAFAPSQAVTEAFQNSRPLLEYPSGRWMSVVTRRSI